MLDAKTPEEVKDYGIDWSPYLASGITISTSVWRVPAGLTNDNDDVDGLATMIRLSGGVADQDYPIVNTITTSDGETLQQGLTVRVRAAETLAVS